LSPAATAGGRLAWWVRPVNTLMAPAVWRGRRRPGPSFGALAERAARRAGLPGPAEADAEFVADLRVPHESFLAVRDLSFIGLAGIRAELLRHLGNRLRVRAYLQIAAAPVPRPVFVLGLPRTGTTLHW
jgi:hypothetical protein